MRKGDENAGELPTGDMGYWDEEGYLYIVGRKSRFAKIYGKRINLDDIEKMLRDDYEGEIAVISDDKRIYILTEEERIGQEREELCCKVGLPYQCVKVKWINAIPRKENGKHYISLCEDGYFAGLRNFVQDARVCPDLFYDVFLDEDLWISSLVVFLMQTNQSIQNIDVVTDYVGRQCDSKERIAAAESLWNLAVRWKQARKLIVKLYFIRREDARLKERTLTRLEDILTDMEKLAEKIPQIQEDEKETGGEKKDKVPESGARKAVCVSLVTHWNNRCS